MVAGGTPQPFLLPSQPSPITRETESTGRTELVQCSAVQRSVHSAPGTAGTRANDGVQAHSRDSNIPDGVHTAATPMTAAANSTGTAPAPAPAPAPEYIYSIVTQQTHTAVAAEDSKTNSSYAQTLS